MTKARLQQLPRYALVLVMSKHCNNLRAHANVTSVDLVTGGNTINAALLTGAILSCLCGIQPLSVVLILIIRCLSQAFKCAAETAFAAHPASFTYQVSRQQFMFILMNVTVTLDL